MSIGNDFRQGFLAVFEHAASPVAIFRKYGTDSQTSFETQGLKNNKKNRPDEHMFQFLEVIDVKLGDVIQQDGSRDLWEVSEIEDKIIAGTFVSFDAMVHKLPGTFINRKSNAPPANVTVHGNIVGALQVNSPGANQAVQMHDVSIVQNELSALRDLLKDQRISDLDREDGREALQRIEELSKRPKTSELIERIRQKLQFVRTIFGVAKDVSILAAPYLDAIGQKLTS